MWVGVALSSKTRLVRGPKIRINCPECGAAGAAAKTHEQIDTLEIFWIPFCKTRITYVECGQCQRKLMARLALDAIGRYDPDELAPFLGVRISPVGKLFAILSVALCWAPFVGLVLGVLGIVTNMHSTGWPKRTSIVGTVLSALVTTGVIILLAVAQ